MIVPVIVKILKDKFQEDFGIELKASINPRRKKE